VDPNASGNDTIHSNPEAFPNAETRELAGVLRELGRFPEGDPRINWQESRRRDRDILHGIFRRQDGGLERKLKGVSHEIGGDEHLVYLLPGEPDRVYKATYQDSFGCRSAFDPIDPDLTGKNFNAILNDDPRFYIRRWILLNTLGGYKTRFEGILPPERPGWLPRICVSQPWLPGKNPAAAEISRRMEESGLREVSREAFYAPTHQVLLTDCAPRNVRITTEGIFPFDAIAEQPSPEIRMWLGREIPP
jgi:hypothetical protein